MWRTTFLMCFTVSRWKLTVAKVSQDPKLIGDKSLKRIFFLWWHLNGKILTGPDKPVAASHRFQAFSISMSRCNWLLPLFSHWGWLARSYMLSGAIEFQEEVFKLRHWDLIVKLQQMSVFEDEQFWILTVTFRFLIRHHPRQITLPCQKSTLPSFVSGTEPSWHLKSSRRSCFPSVCPSATGRTWV